MRGELMERSRDQSKRSLMLASVLGLACAVLGAARPAPAGEDDDDRGSRSESRKLVGAWHVQVTVRNCSTGAALGNPFPTMLAFQKGGTLTSADTAFNPSLRSPGVGVWRRTAGDAYTASTYAFLFNATGAWTGTHRIVQTIKIGDDPDQFEGTASVEILDKSGNITFTGCSTSVGQRIRE
jgi:hypothetical protein